MITPQDRQRAFLRDVLMDVEDWARAGKKSKRAAECGVEALRHCAEARAFMGEGDWPNPEGVKPTLPPREPPRDPVQIGSALSRTAMAMAWRSAAGGERLSVAIPSVRAWLETEIRLAAKEPEAEANPAHWTESGETQVQGQEVG